MVSVVCGKSPFSRPREYVVYEIIGRVLGALLAVLQRAAFTFREDETGSK